MNPPVISPPTQSDALPVTSILPPFLCAPMWMPALPAMRVFPPVMPRPIHFTRVKSPRSSTSSLPSPSTSKSSSSRSRRLPRKTGRARTASWRSPARRSGESTSASRGTAGCSLSVTAVMRWRLSQSLRQSAIGNLHSVHPFGLDGIVVERHGVVLLEQRADEFLDLVVVGRPDNELAALDRLAHFPFFNDDHAALND